MVLHFSVQPTFIITCSANSCRTSLLSSTPLAKEYLAPCWKYMALTCTCPLHPSSSTTTLPFTKLILFRNGYRYRPISNSLAGHHKHLLWNPSTMFGVSWKGKCRKLGPSSLPEQQWPLGHCVWCLEGRCFVSALRSITKFEWDQWSKHRSTQLFIKEFNFFKQPF